MKNKIIVFGDSITYGQRDLDMGGWVNRLKLALAHDSSITSCHVFNMGISGQSTSDILERMDAECRGRLLDDTNNIIVIAVGINDSQEIDGEIVTDENTFKKNVEELIEHAKAHSSNVIYLGLTPVDDERTGPVWWDKSRCWVNERVKRYDEIISEVCRNNRVRYVYVFDQIDPAGNEDGLHPAAEGHKILADIMENVVREYIHRTSRLSMTANAGLPGLAERVKKELLKIFRL